MAMETLTQKFKISEVKSDMAILKKTVEGLIKNFNNKYKGGAAAVLTDDPTSFEVYLNVGFLNENLFEE